MISNSYSIDGDSRPRNGLNTKDLNMDSGTLIQLLDDSEHPNTYILKELEHDEVALFHYLNDKIYLVKKRSEIGPVQPEIKTSTERSLLFAKANTDYINFNLKADLEALILYFVVNKNLTSKQKSDISRINGIIASIKLNNNIKKAIDFIIENQTILDEFNLMWFNKFSELFKDPDKIVSKKQRASIFNISGFVSSELEIYKTNQ